jgi:hypothetical protein
MFLLKSCNLRPVYPRKENCEKRLKQIVITTVFERGMNLTLPVSLLETGRRSKEFHIGEGGTNTVGAMIRLPGSEPGALHAYECLPLAMHQPGSEDVP